MIRISTVVNSGLQAQGGMSRNKGCVMVTSHLKQIYKCLSLEDKHLCVKNCVNIKHQASSKVS